jgi:selenocysteine-specific elongation factor
VHGALVPRAQSGQRTAVNLAGVEVSEIERGMTLAPIGLLLPTQIIDVELEVLPTAPRPIRTRARVRVHLGSAEVLARIRVLNIHGELAPGDSGFAQFRFESPVVALHEERFIIRSYSPAETIAGGLVLDPQATKHRGREMARTQERLQVLLDSQRPGKVGVFVAAAGDHGLRTSDIAARTGWNNEVVIQVAKQAQQARIAGGAATIMDADGVLVSTENFERLSRITTDEVQRHHEREPLARGLARETLRERHFTHAAPEIFRAVISRLEKEGVLVAEKDIVRASKHGQELSPADEQLRDKIAQAYKKSALEAPTLDQALVEAGIPTSQRTHARKILQLLIDDGTLVRVQGEMFFHAHAIELLKSLLSEFATAHEPDRLIDVPGFKDLAGVSRKYAIPLLEYFDRERITVRSGDKRIFLK